VNHTETDDEQANTHEYLKAEQANTHEYLKAALLCLEADLTGGGEQEHERERVRSE